MDIFSYLVTNTNQVWGLLLDHIRLTVIAVGLAILVGVPLGILISYIKSLSRPILGITNLIQAIPSMALLGFAIPLLGIGTVPAVVVVFLYSLLPIIKNTYIGILQINPQLIEAARGIGMTRFNILYKIQIPLTLPTLMAGVRISSVTAVGLMTIAAFIGAGGLGFLVFSGISSVNTAMILAGAIPACILALTVDWILSLVEDLVTPMSLRPGVLKNRRGEKQQRRIKKLIIAGTFCVLLGVFGSNIYQTYYQTSNIIRIGSKQFSEQLILGNLLKELIEAKTNLKVESHFGAGGTQVLFSALKNGDIDIYVDYTGTILVDILKQPPETNAKQVYKICSNEMKNKYNILLLSSLNFNNTYALAVSQQIADQYHLSTISDLANVAPFLQAGTTLEFLNRQDGLPGLEQTYNFSFANVTGIDGSNWYIALKNGNVSVIDAFTTDGLLKKFNLHILEDDKHFFPPYYAVPLIRSDVLKKHPELRGIIASLDTKLTNTVMQELNYQVDELHQDPADVAHQFLIKEGLI